MALKAGWGSPLAIRNGFDEDDGFQNSPLGLESCERDGCSMDSDESMADQNVHHRVVQNTYKLQFGSFGEWQSDMNDGVIYDITNNSTKTIVFGANLSKNIVEKNLFFKYGKTLVRI